MGRSTWPRSDRPRSSYGSLLGGVQTAKGLCPSGRCFLKANHEGECYPR